MMWAYTAFEQCEIFKHESDERTYSAQLKVFEFKTPKTSFNWTNNH